jgi:hypothetical protein
MAAILEEAQERNFTLWPILGVYVWPNPGALPDTYAGEVQKMKNWLENRLDWMDFAINQSLPYLDADFGAQALSAYLWQFDATATGGDLQYSWDFDDGTGSSEAAPQHQFPGTGTYNVRLTVSTPFGCSNSSQQIIHIVSTGTQEGEAPMLHVFPNPADERVVLVLPDNFTGSNRLRVVNALGQTVVDREMPASGKQMTLDVAELPAGAYGISVESAGKRAVARVVIH